MKFKQVLAGLLVGAMVVTSAPVSGLGALSAMAAEEDAKTAITAPQLSVVKPATGATPAEVTSLDSTSVAQKFVDAAENPATLTSTNVQVTKDADGDAEVQAFSGMISAANDAENNSKLNINGNTPFVIKFRMKTDAVTSTNWLVGKMDWQYGVQIGPNRNNNKMAIELYSAASNNSWPTLTYYIEDTDAFWNTWHDVMAVYTGKTFALYVDGEAAENTDIGEFTIPDNAGSIFTIGYNDSKKTGEEFTNPYAGKFADMEIYSGGEEIAKDATAETIEATLVSRTKVLDIDAAAATTTDANYTVATAWTDSKGTTVTAFEADKAYTMTATLTAKEGFKFTAENVPTTIKVGETETANVTATVAEDGATMTVTATFGEDKTETPAEDTYEALAADKMTGTADSQELTGESSGAQGLQELAVDGDESTYWHSKYNGGNDVKLGQENSEDNENNNYYITLDKTYTVNAVTYVPRTNAEGKVTGNGYITECNVYTSVSEEGDEDWVKAGESGAWTYEDSNVERTVTFDNAVEGVKRVKIEVLHTKGETDGNADKFINAAEFGVKVKKETTAPEPEKPVAPSTDGEIDKSVEGKETVRYATDTEITEATGKNERVEDFFKGTKAMKWSVDFKVTDGSLQSFLGLNTNDKYYTLYMKEKKVKFEAGNDNIIAVTNNTYADDAWHTAEVELDATGKATLTVYNINAETGEKTVAETVTTEAAKVNVSNLIGDWAPTNFTIGGMIGYRQAGGWVLREGTSVKNVVLTKDLTDEAPVVDQVIAAPSITVTEPAAEATPVKPTAAEDANYTLEAEWKEGETALAEDAKFEAGKSYTLTLTLAAKEGYKFDETSKPAGATATVSENGKTMTLVYSYTLEANKPVEVTYAKLTGLTGAADSEEPTGEGAGQGTVDKALDGDATTFWHTNWNDNNAPKVEFSNGTLTGNNTYTITLAKAASVKSVTYQPRNHYDRTGVVANGAITECKVHVSTDNGKTWIQAGEISGDNAWTYVDSGQEGADQNFVEKTIELTQVYDNVTSVKFEVIHTAGIQANEFINAAEFGVIGAENETPTPEVSEARKALAAALAKVADVKEESAYTEDSYAAYKTALEAAQAVTAETSDEDVQAAATALENAIKGLTEKQVTPEKPEETKTMAVPEIEEYEKPVAGSYPWTPEIYAVDGAVAYTDVADRAENPATFTTHGGVESEVEVNEYGLFGFTARLTAANGGANNDKFNVYGSTPMALRMKVKADKVEEIINVIGKMDSQYGVQIDGTSNRVILYCNDANNKWPEIEYDFSKASEQFWGSWHEIVVVYSGEDLQLYVDGDKGNAVAGRPNAEDGYKIGLKQDSGSVFTIGYNVGKSTEHGADGNGKVYSTLDQANGQAADIEFFSGTDFTAGMTRDYVAIRSAMDGATPVANITAKPYDVKTTWKAGDTVLAGGNAFAGETVYTAETVITAHDGFKFSTENAPEGATVSADGKTVTYTKTFEKTGKLTCTCDLNEVTGFADQTVAMGVADSKTATFSAAAEVTGDCKVEHSKDVTYTYTVTSGEGATISNNVLTVTKAGTVKVKVVASLTKDGGAKVTKEKEITVTVTSDKATDAEKKTLTDAINAVKDVKEADYTEASYKALKTAIDNANKIAAKANASKTEVDNAVKAIETAKKNLKTKLAAAKEELGALMDEVEGLKAELYTTASYNHLVEVYNEKARPVYNNASSTVEELNAAIDAIKAAKDALVTIEKEELDKVTAEKKALLDEAMKLMIRITAGEVEATEAQMKALSDAMNALEKAPVDADAATLRGLMDTLKKAQTAITNQVVLAAPTVKAVKATAAKGGVFVKVTVNPVANASTYDVYRVVGGKAEKVGSTAAGATTVTDKNAVKGASYYAVAVSADGKTVSKAGAAVAVNLAKAPKIKKAKAGNKSATLSWKKAKGAKVVVYRSTKKDSGYKRIGKTKKNAVSFVSKKLKAGKTYFYKIATVKGKVVSAMSKAKKVKIKK